MSTEVLRDLYERPIPPTEVVAALKRVDDRLNLRYIVHKRLDYTNMNISEQWAIIERWTENEPRRRMIQLGQMADDSDFDVLCYLPIDCDKQDAFNYFQRAVLGQFKGRPDRERMLSRLQLFNEEKAKEVKAAVMEQAEELIEANAQTLFKEQHGKVSQKVFVKEDVKK